MKLNYQLLKNYNLGNDELLNTNLKWVQMFVKLVHISCNHIVHFAFKNMVGGSWPPWHWQPLTINNHYQEMFFFAMCNA